MVKAVFKKGFKYITPSGKRFGKGVWYDTERNKIIKPGEGCPDKKTGMVTQYNSDGTKTVYTREQWHSKKTKDHETALLQNDRRWGIPYIPEKKMTITIDKNSPTRRNAGATFSENMLDSIAVNAKRAGIPFSTGLALASTESTLGNAKGRRVGNTLLPWLMELNKDRDAYRQKAKSISYRGYYSPTALISNWTQIAENPYYAYEYDSRGYLRTTPQPNSYYEQDFRSAVNKDTAYFFDRKNPLQSGFDYYKKKPTDYNPGDPHYQDKVEANRRELVNYSPEIRAYMQRNNLKAKGGPLGNWTIQDEANYREWRSKLPKNLRDTDDNIYDMRGAYKAGMQPEWNEEDKSYHLGSRDPKTGRILKAPHHHTYLKALLEDASLGYYPTTDKNGNTYTETWEGNNRHDNGGYLEEPIKTWDSLSLREKSEIIKVALRNSITTLPEIREAYNSFANGGSVENENENLFAAGGKKNSSREGNSRRAMRYLMSRGMSKIGASAMIGTLQAESGLNPAIHAQMKGDDGEGLAQWTGSRKQDFWNTLERIEPGARKKYGTISRVPFERQLDVVMAERPEITSAINRAKDVHAATDIMLRGYENGSKSAGNMASKQQINSIYGKWNNGYDRQFGVRVGNAKNLLRLNVDTSWMDKEQNDISTLNAQIANIDTSTLPSIMPDKDPALSYKAPVIDWSAIKEDKAPIEEFTYNPKEEKEDNLQKLNTVMGMMGYENPLGNVMQTVTDYSNPLMAVANMYGNKYEDGGNVDKPSSDYTLHSNIIGQKQVYRDGDEYYTLDEDNHRVLLARDGDWGIENNPSTWQFKDADGRIYSPQGTTYGEHHTPHEKGLVPTSMFTTTLNGAFNLPFQGLEYAATGHGLQEELPEEGDALMVMAAYAPAFKGGATALKNIGERGINAVYNANRDVIENTKIYKTLEEIIDNGTFGDPYTTFRGRLGSYGDNILSNIYGTLSRDFNLPDKARVPADAIRKIKGDIDIKNGLVDLTGNKNYLGNPHINVTFDRPVVSHSAGEWDGADTYLFPTKSLLDQTYPTALKSIEPSDVFANGIRVTERPKNVTLISGDIEALEKAQKAGMQTLSSPRLRKLYKESLASNPKEVGIWPEYAAEIQRLQSKRGTPTLEDFRLLEQTTGLKSGVAPISEYENAVNAIENMPHVSINDLMNGKVSPYRYPNGRDVEWSKENIQNELGILRKSKYNKVFYDPMTQAEANWLY